MPNPFDFDSNASTNFMDGSSASNAMGAPGLQLPPNMRPIQPSNAAAQAMNADNARTAAFLGSMRKPEQQPSASIYYNPQEDKFLSGFGPVSLANLTEADNAIKQGALNKGYAGQVPAGYLPTTAADITKAMQERGQMRGFWDGAKEVGRNVVTSVAGGIPEMVGKTVQFASDDKGFGHDYGQGLRDFGEYNKKALGGAPDLYGRGEVSSALIEGASNLGPSGLGMVAATVAPEFALPAIVVLFGGAQAQDTYEGALKKGLDKSTAMEAALKTGGIEGAGEAIADLIGGKLISGGNKLLQTLTRSGKITAEEAVQIATDPKMLRQFGKSMLGAYATEMSTEFAQGYGEAAVEKDYGIRNANPMEEGIHGAKVAAGMTTLLAPFGLRAHHRAAQNRAALGEAINNPDKPTDMLQASQLVRDEITPMVGKEDANQWLNGQNNTLLGSLQWHQPVDLAADAQAAEGARQQPQDVMDRFMDRREDNEYSQLQQEAERQRAARDYYTGNTPSVAEAIPNQWNSAGDPATAAVADQAELAAKGAGAKPNVRDLTMDQLSSQTPETLVELLRTMSETGQRVMMSHIRHDNPELARQVSVLMQNHGFPESWTAVQVETNKPAPPAAAPTFGNEIPFEQVTPQQLMVDGVVPQRENTTVPGNTVDFEPAQVTPPAGQMPLPLTGAIGTGGMSLETPVEQPAEEAAPVEKDTQTIPMFGPKGGVNKEAIPPSAKQVEAARKKSYREKLDAMYDAGRLTDDQAEALDGHIEAGRWDRADTIIRTSSKKKPKAKKAPKQAPVAKQEVQPNVSIPDQAPASSSVEVVQDERPSDDQSNTVVEVKADEPARSEAPAEKAEVTTGNTARDIVGRHDLTKESGVLDALRELMKRDGVPTRVAYDAEDALALIEDSEDATERNEEVQSARKWLTVKVLGHQGKSERRKTTKGSAADVPTAGSVTDQLNLFGKIQAATHNNPDADNGADMGATRFKNGEEAAAWFAKNASTPFLRLLAARLAPHLKGVSIDYWAPGDTPTKDVPGSIRNATSRGTAALNPTTGQVRVDIRADLGNNEVTILHELVHAATMRRLEDPKLAAGLEKLRKRVISTLGTDEGRYPINDKEKAAAQTFFAKIMEDSHEFLAYALTSPSFRKIMDRMTAEGRWMREYHSPEQLARVNENAGFRKMKTARAAPLTFWQSFVDFVRNVFGLPKVYAPQLDAILKKNAEIQENNRKAETVKFKTLEAEIDHLFTQLMAEENPALLGTGANVRAEAGGERGLAGTQQLSKNAVAGITLPDMLQSLEPAGVSRRGFLRTFVGLAVGAILPQSKAYAAGFESKVRAGDIKGALDLIAAGDSNPAFRVLAKKLAALVDKNISVRVVEIGKVYKEGLPTSLASAAGVAKIDRENGKVVIWLRGDIGVGSDTVLHETIHAVLLGRYDMLNYYNANKKLRGRSADPVLKLYDEVHTEFRAAMRELTGKTDERGVYAALEKIDVGLAEAFNKPDEFITYALTSVSVQETLRKHRYKGATLWGKFKEFAKGVLGFGGSEPSWFDAAIRVGNEVLDAAAGDKADFKVSKQILELTGKKSDEHNSIAPALPIPDSPAGAAQAVGDFITYNRSTSTAKDWAKRGMLKLMNLPQLAETYGDKIPALKTFVAHITEMAKMKNTLSQYGEGLAKKFRALDKAGQKRLSRALQEMTVEKLQSKIIMDNGKVAGVEGFGKNKDAANAILGTLTAAERRLYGEIKAEIFKLRKDLLSSLQKRVEISGDKGDWLLEHLKNAHTEYDYFPLMRFGDHNAVWKSDAFVAAEDAKDTDALIKMKSDGEHYFVRSFESSGEANKFIAEVNAKQKGGKAYYRQTSEYIRSVSSASPQFMEKLDTLFKDDKSTHSQVMALYLQSQPEFSAAKRSLRRMNVSGYDENALQAFGRYVDSATSSIARNTFANQIKDDLNNGRQQAGDAEKGGDAQFKAISDTMNQHYNALVNPVSPPGAWQGWATKMAYVYYLGFTPSFALTNLMQGGMISAPVIAARLNTSSLRVYKELTGALKDAFALQAQWLGEAEGTLFNKILESGPSYIHEAGSVKLDLSKTKLAKDEKELVQYLYDQSVVDLTQEMDLQALSGGESERVRAVMKAAAVFAHHSEVLNRLSTGLAAYRLAKSTKGEAGAREFSVRIINDTHFNYAGEMAPLVMKPGYNAMAPIMFQFRKYQQAMLYLVGRNAGLAIRGAKNALFKGGASEAEKEAMRTINGLVATHLVAAGSLGLPLANSIFGAAAFIMSGLAGDDDHWDAERAKAEYRTWLADMFGKEAGEVLSRGILRAPGVRDIAPSTLGDRIGLQGIGELSKAQHSGSRDNAKASFYQSVGSLVAGPTGGLIGDMLTARDYFSKGEMERGWEYATPKAIRDALKTSRFNSEGVVNSKGLTEVDPSKLGPVEKFWQAMGYTPADVAEHFESKAANYSYDTALNDRKKMLVNQFANGRHRGDSEMQAEALKRISQFNASHPENPILAKEYFIAARNRMRDQANMDSEGNVQNTRKPSTAEKGRFANVD